jgi:hypothetical protein
MNDKHMATGVTFRKFLKKTVNHFELDVVPKCPERARVSLAYSRVEGSTEGSKFTRLNVFDSYAGIRDL